MAKPKKPKKKAMAVTTRQEINILDHTLTATSGASNTSNEIVQLDSSKYLNPTYYFEVIAKSSLSITFTVTLRRNGTSTDDATCNIPLLTTDWKRIRSSSFTPPAGNQAYVVFIDTALGANKDVKSARIIVIDNPTTLVSTETQIEIGNYETDKTNTTDAALDVPKYWLYTAANYDGSLVFLAEVVYVRSSNMNTTTVKLQEDNGSFGSWADKATIVNAGSDTTPIRVRLAFTARFTPTDGRHYRIVSVSSSNMSTYDIYCAKIIIQQVDGAQLQFGGGGGSVVQGGTASSGQTNQARGQSFKIRATSTITAVNLRLSKTGTPTDTLNIDITSSLGGSSLANANINISTLTTSFVTTTLTFGTPVSLTGGSTYYLEFTRSGARDTSNYPNVEAEAIKVYADGDGQLRNNNTWQAAVQDHYFQLIGQSGISLLENQYLLLNSTDGIVGLQKYQTLFDTDEWVGVTNTYYHAHDASNSADSSKLTDITPAADVDITNSTVTGANQQISSALSGLVDNDEIDTNTITSTGIIGASRILVAISVSTTTSTLNAFKSLLGVGL